MPGLSPQETRGLPGTHNRDAEGAPHKTRQSPALRKPKMPARDLTDSVEQFPDPGEMMIVVFGDKIQMVHEPHRRLQTRVENGSRRK